MRISDKFCSFREKAGESVRENFRHATPKFLFIILYVNVFQWVFGAENSIVGVIFTIMMSASMARDLTATPLRHLLIQSFVLVSMAVSACYVNVLSPFVALPLNFLVIALILYAFTYEYASHLYFPYILSYLFLVFISPVPPERLPTRLLGMLAGAVSIILYQLFMGRRRVRETTRDKLLSILAEARVCAECLLSGQGRPDTPETVHQNLCALSRMIYERRRRALCISDASFAVLDSAQGLENLILRLYELQGPMTAERERLLRGVLGQLEGCRAFVARERKTLDPIPEPEGDEARELYPLLRYIRAHLLRMTQKSERRRYRRTALSFSLRLRSALRLSPVRAVYALRVAALLAAGTLLVQLLGLPHGKWLLFTIASVSLPYAEDVGTKARQRLAATLIGGAAAVALFTLVSSGTGRTVVMMLSGYVSFFLTGYTATFSSSTVGALGGAVFVSSFGFGPVARMFAVRVCYVLAGIAVALLFNCAVLPFRRERASHQLFEKFAATTRLLASVCRAQEVDTQLYYNLVIQSHMQEEKLLQNAADGGFDGMDEKLEAYRRLVREAHRGRAGTPAAARAE